MENWFFPDFRPRYGYKWWIEGVPCTRKGFIAEMERLYKRAEEERQYDKEFFQEEL